jgi:hypothetical protein
LKGWGGVYPLFTFYTRGETMIRHFEFFAVQQHPVYHKTRMQNAQLTWQTCLQCFPLTQLFAKSHKGYNFQKKFF